MSSSTLKPAAELAKASGFRYPNESAAYRRAREALLEEEIELRRHIERVAEQRRRLPPGGEVKKNYAFDGEVPDILQRVALAVVARSPIERLKAFKRERGWHYLPLYQDLSGEFSRDYHALTKAGGDDAAFNVFTKRDGIIRHFWGGEMNAATADPGQDPRGAPDLMPLWTILDVTPEGRGTDWYPKLNY